jgi:hypothetical protein
MKNVKETFTLFFENIIREHGTNDHEWLVECAKENLEALENLQNDRDKYRHTLQRIMWVLGPSVPKDVDYTQQNNLAGLITELETALTILENAGIEYRRGTKIVPGVNTFETGHDFGDETCHHEWVLYMMPAVTSTGVYEKPGVTRCSKCGAFKPSEQFGVAHE